MLVRRMLLTSVVATALAGCASGAQVASLSQPSPAPTTSVLTGTSAPAAPSATTSSATAQPSALTCGTIPASDGKLKTALTVHIDGPTVAVSGATFTAQVAITATQPTVDLSSSTFVTLLIAQGQVIVGRSSLPGAAAGFEPTITPSAPATLPASITLSGCARPPLDQTNADLTRQPLPPGAYTIYAVVVEYDGDSETDRTNLVSAPFPIQITADPTASRAIVSAQTPTPTVAPSLPTGSTACGNSLISATTPTGTEPLLDCAGMAYGSSTIQVHVGDQILLSGLEGQTFVTSSPAAILDVHGSLLTARQLGAATITVHNWFCVPVKGTQATSCPLAQVTVT